MLAVCEPAALVSRTVEVNNFALAFFYPLDVLAVVYVATLVKQLADIGTDILVELPLEYDACVHQQPALAMHLVIFVVTLVNDAVLEPHLALVPHVVFPGASERGAVRPGDSAEPVSFA